MLNEIEIENLKKYIYEISDEEFSKYALNQWKPMEELNKMISVKTAIDYVRGGYFDGFNTSDNYYRVVDGKFKSVNTFEFTDSDRNDLVNKLINTYDWEIPYDIREAISWKPKEFNIAREFPSFLRHFCEYNGESYYGTKTEIIKTKVNSVLDKELKFYFHKDIERLKKKNLVNSKEEIDNFIYCWNYYWNEFVNKAGEGWGEPYKITSKYNGEFFYGPQYTRNRLFGFGEWTRWSVEDTLAEKYERINEDGSRDEFFKVYKTGWC